MLTPATGAFKGVLRNDGTIDFDLDDQDTLGTIVQAHIHFGQKDVNGGGVRFGRKAPRALPGSFRVS